MEATEPIKKKPTERPGNTETMRFRFPAPIEQINECTVTMEVPTGNFPALSDKLMEQIRQRLGDRDGERFIEEATEEINRQMVIRSII